MQGDVVALFVSEEAVQGPFLGFGETVLRREAIAAFQALGIALDTLLEQHDVRIDHLQRDVGCYAQVERLSFLLGQLLHQKVRLLMLGQVLDSALQVRILGGASHKATQDLGEHG